MILITDAATEKKIEILASPKFDELVYTSVTIPRARLSP
jgi:hypothetical protein